MHQKVGKRIEPIHYRVRCGQECSRRNSSNGNNGSCNSCSWQPRGRRWHWNPRKGWLNWERKLRFELSNEKEICLEFWSFAKITSKRTLLPHLPHNLWLGWSHFRFHTQTYLTQESWSLLSNLPHTPLVLNSIIVKIMERIELKFGAL